MKGNFRHFKYEKYKAAALKLTDLFIYFQKIQLWVLYYSCAQISKICTASYCLHLSDCADEKGN